MSNEVFRQSYGYIELTLANGNTLRAKPLPLEDAADWLDACVIALDEGADTTARYRAVGKIVRDFPEAIGAGDAFEGMTPFEVAGAAFRFFTGRPMRPNGTEADDDQP